MIALRLKMNGILSIYIYESKWGHEWAVTKFNEYDIDGVLKEVVFSGDLWVNLLTKVHMRNYMGIVMAKRVRWSKLTIYRKPTLMYNYDCALNNINVVYIYNPLQISHWFKSNRFSFNSSWIGAIINKCWMKNHTQNCRHLSEQWKEKKHIFPFVSQQENHVQRHLPTWHQSRRNPYK